MEPHSKHGRAKRWLGWLAGIAVVTAPSGAFGLATSEYALKAVFLFNFAQFVEWPDGAFESAESPINVCVLGNDPFGAQLDEVMEGERINGRSIIVQRPVGVEDATDCHVLFVSAASKDTQRAVLERLKGEPILTVGESLDFTSAGGMIRFFMEDNRVRIEINPDAAEDAHLRLSSKLLRSSQILAKRGQ
jgi:hypothetical protein